MSNIAYTSREAYAGIKPKLGIKQKIVYQAIETLGEATSEKVADFLGEPINYVSGRFTELKNYGMIVSTGTTKNKSGSTAKTWAIKTLNDSNLSRIAKELPKYEAVPWLNDAEDCVA